MPWTLDVHSEMVQCNHDSFQKEQQILYKPSLGVSVLSVLVFWFLKLDTSQSNSLGEKWRSSVEPPLSKLPSELHSWWGMDELLSRGSTHSHLDCNALSAPGWILLQPMSRKAEERSKLKPPFSESLEWAWKSSGRSRSLSQPALCWEEMSASHSCLLKYYYFHLY